MAVFVIAAAPNPGNAGGPVEVKRQLLGEPESLDPQLISGSTDFDLVEDLFEGLTAQGADGAVVPGLAERWEVSADRLSWMFHLRADLQWSDGRPLGAEDVVWALRRAVTPVTASPYASSLLPLRHAREILAGKTPADSLGVTAVDARTVRVELDEPTPFLPAVLALPVTYPLPRTAIEKWGKDWSQPGHMVCDGPFVLTAWTPEEELLLERNQHFHDAASVKLDRVRWLLAADRKAGLRRYQAGELDSALLSAEDYPWAIKNRAGELRSVPLLATRYLIVQMAHGPLSQDPRLREALSLVVDRDLLVDRIDTRGQIAAWSLVPPNMKPYEPPLLADRSRAIDQRREEAKRLWTEATGPASITLLVERDDVDHRLGEALRAMWQAALPVKVSLDEAEWPVFNSAIRNGDFQITLGSWYADYADPWTFLANFTSDAGPLNGGRFASQTYDAALDAAKALDGAARLAALQKAERRLLDSYAIIPVEHVVSQKLVNPKLQGWKADPFDMNLSRYLSFSD